MTACAHCKYLMEEDGIRICRFSDLPGNVERKLLDRCRPVECHICGEEILWLDPAHAPKGALIRFPLNVDEHYPDNIGRSHFATCKGFRPAKCRACLAPIFFARIPGNGKMTAFNLDCQAHKCGK